MTICSGVSSDNARLLCKEELTYGVPEGGEYAQRRFVAFNIAQNTETTESNEIDPNRQVTDLIRTNITTGGSIDGELSYGTYDAELEAVLASDPWSTPTVALSDTGNLEVIIDDSTNTITAIGLFASGFAVGDWISLGNFVNAANNVTVRILQIVDDDNIVVGYWDALVSETVIADAGGANATITIASLIENGATCRSFTYELQYTDLAKNSVYTGNLLDTLALSAQQGQPMTVSFGALGKLELPPNASSVAGSIGAPTVTDVMNSVDNLVGIVLGDFVVGGSPSDCIATQTNINIANNLRARNCIGLLGPNSYGIGKFNVTGDIQLYFEDQQALTDYLNFNDSALVLFFKDKDGNQYIMDIGRVKFSSAPHPITGTNADVFLDLSFQALGKQPENYTMRIVRVPAA